MNRIVWIFVCTAFLAGVATGQSTNDSTSTADAPTLADVAKSQHKSKVKHVYNTEDMKAADPADSVSSGAADPADAGSTTANDASPSAKKSVAKKPDAAAIEAAKAKVDGLKKEEEGLSGAVGNLQRLIDEEPSRQNSIGAGLEKQKSDLAIAKKNREQAEQQLNALQNPK